MTLGEARPWLDTVHVPTIFNSIPICVSVSIYDILVHLKIRTFIGSPNYRYVILRDIPEVDGIFGPWKSRNVNIEAQFIRIQIDVDVVASSIMHNVTNAIDQITSNTVSQWLDRSTVKELDGFIFIQ
jgi:hypothetical protein